MGLHNVNPHLVVVCVVVLAPSLGACAESTTSDASIAPASASSSIPSSEVEGMITDPLGDALLSSAPGYVDVRSAGVFEEADTFSFTATLAAPIPSPATVPTDWDAVLWSFCLDTDNSSDPHGYPFAATTVVPCEFIVAALSKGEDVTGNLIDRRP